MESAELKSLFYPPDGRSIPGTPGSLLSAAAEVVDFYGREDILTDLTAWRDSAYQFSVILVTSEGGQGKTRLAREFLHQSRPSEWVGGFLKYPSLGAAGRIAEQREFSEDLRALRASTLPVLIVVDYAETRTEEITIIAGQMFDESPTSPIRLLLLSRNAGDWWENFTEELPQDAVRLITLPALTTNERPARESAYTTAVACFARGLPNLPEPAVQKVDARGWGAFAEKLVENPPELTDSSFGNALTLQMTALANLMSLACGEKRLSLIPGEEQSLIRHERDYLVRVAGRHGLLDAGILSTRTSPDARLREAKGALDRAVAGLILLGPRSRDDALSIAALTSDRVTVDVADWLATIYPPSSQRDSYIGEVQPDRLAELLLGGILERQYDFLDEVARLVTDFSTAQAALFTLTRTAAHHEYLSIAERISDLITRFPGIFAPPALVIAAQIINRSPLYDGLIRLGELDSDGFKQYALAPARWLPSHSTSLAYFSADLTQLAADILRRLAAMAPDTYLPEFSTALNDLANRQAEIGRSSDALQTAQDAVDIRRGLASSFPEEYESLLAGSLNNLAIILRRSGRGADAISPARESLSLLRVVYAREDTDDNLARVAGTLNTLAGTLDRETSGQEIIDSIEESVKHFRYLAKKDRRSYLSGLAIALMTLGASLYAQGKFRGGVSASREAVKYLRTLAREDADAYLPDLADSLSNFAHGLDEIGRKASALRSMDEVVRIRSKLAKSNPIYLPDLSDSLVTLTKMLAEIGQLQRALSAARKAVRCYRTLAEEDPDAYEPLLAEALDNLAMALASIDKYDEASLPAQESVKIQTKLTSRDASRNPALADSTSMLAYILVHLWQSHPTEERAVQIADHFRFCTGVDREKYLSGLVGSLINVALTLADNQNLGRAKEVAVEAIVESRDLNGDAHVNPPDLPDLAVALVTLAKTLLGLGEPEISVDAAGEAVRHFRAIMDAGNKSYLGDFTEALMIYASTMLLTGRAAGSIDVFREAASKLRVLAKRDKRTHLPTLAACLNDLAGILSDHGSPAEAVLAASEAVGYYQSLADQDPSFGERLARGLVTYGHSLVKNDQHLESISHLWRAMHILKDASDESKSEVYVKAITNIRLAYAACPDDVAAEYQRITGDELPDFMKSMPED
jgi:hypothetical protein